MSSSTDNGLSSAAQTEQVTLLRTFLEHRTAISRLIRRVLGRADPEDLLQETIARAIEAQTRRTIETPKAYLFTTARHLALKERARLAARLTDHAGDLLDAAEFATCDAFVESEVEGERMLALFQAALESLPEQCRRVYLLRKVYGLSHQELAQLLGISVKTVERHIAKALLRCGEQMEAGGYPLPNASTPGPRHKSSGAAPAVTAGSRATLE